MEAMGALHWLGQLLEIHYTALLAVIFVFCAVTWRQSRRGLPPGPLGLPILGYLPFLSDDLHLDFMKIRKKYGNIFSLKIGVRTAVVINDFSTIKEAFHKEEISDKPPGFLKLSDNVQHLGDNEGWKDWRRFILSSLRTMGMGKKKLEAAVEEQVQGVLERFSQSQGDIDLHEIIYPAINNIIISMICGKKMKEDTSFSKTVDSYSKSMLKIWNAHAILLYLPFLKPISFLLNSKLKKEIKIMELMEQNTWEEISSHEKELDDGEPEDFIDHYLKEFGKGKEKKSYFDNAHLNGNCQVLLLAGNDTSLTTIEWVLLRLAQRQDIQERVYQEIVQVFGKEKSPSWADKDQLPLLDAVLAESSRMSSIVPFAVPHWTNRDTKIGNYQIPKDTIVFINLYAVHMDPKLWNNPEEFNPDRFLTPEGKRIKDPEYLIPFGIGKRSCVGERLAREEVFVLVSAILQHFKILPSSRGVSFESETAIVVHPKHPVIRVEQRL